MARKNRNADRSKYRNAKKAEREQRVFDLSEGRKTRSARFSTPADYERKPKYKESYED